MPDHAETRISADTQHELKEQRSVRNIFVSIVTSTPEEDNSRITNTDSDMFIWYTKSPSHIAILESGPLWRTIPTMWKLFKPFLSKLYISRIRAERYSQLGHSLSLQETAHSRRMPTKKEIPSDALQGHFKRMISRDARYISLLFSYLPTNWLKMYTNCLNSSTERFIRINIWYD
jgi:hypothetical protein